jgi:cyclic dehypoxanthinyl futalosine synthase
MSSEQLDQLYDKALNLEQLSLAEGLQLYHNAPLAELSYVAHEIRKTKKAGYNDVVTWQIDRNMNTTNVCVANCKFCNFFRPPGHADSYITDDATYQRKIEETLAKGGDQLLLQGGHHPELGIDYYEELFQKLKRWYPELKLHALGPPEIDHIAKLSQLSYRETLQRLKAAGMDSLPGAGAEILDDRVRRLVAQGKCNTQEWLDVMHEAHKLDITTSATMMFGHLETVEERFKHWIRVREVQDMKPAHSNGFLAFILWPYQDNGTLLKRVKGIKNETTASEYLRNLAMARIMLPNIENIQVSWLTIGPRVAQVGLYSGANDMGSIMIEENVVSAAGAPYRFTAEGIQQCIREAGFEPRLRDQKYRFREMPPALQQPQEAPVQV